MRILHIVSSISSVNFGVWNAAIFGSKYLEKVHHVKSELWICSRSVNDTVEPEIPYYYFNPKQLSYRGIKKWMNNYSINNTVIVTHGAWLQPTKIGYRAKKKGFGWIYLSQGMLEPLSFQRARRFFKMVYFSLWEKRMSKNADIIRAVSEPERVNLQKLYKTKNIKLIYNGIERVDKSGKKNKDSKTIFFLFLARLHQKKGIIHLVRAWKQVMENTPNVKLLIVGPDEGELVKIKPYLTENTEYIGPVFGAKKDEILKSVHYYVLPSYSEGFPTSVVEAMGFGLIPIISDGCNFPEVFTESLGYHISPNTESIAQVLNDLKSRPFDDYLSGRNIEYISGKLTEEIIGQQLFSLYSNLLQLR